MNASTLLDNFDLIADAPGGVPKMRELILQLAVRGKLVPQDPKDIAAQVTGSDVTTETEPKYAIPAQWIWTQLGCVIDYNYGGKTESERIPADAWLLDLEDIEKDTSRLLQRVLAGDRKSTSTKSQFSAGDVLYGKLRPYLNKVLVANSDGYCTTEIVPMKPLKGVNPHYVVCVLKSRDFLDYTAARSYGMKMPRLGTEDAKRAPFPLPPLPEQKRIVAKVNELMKRCDELENRQKERSAHHKTLVASCLNALSGTKCDPEFIIHNSTFSILFSSPESISELRKTILQLAVQGRLVPRNISEPSGMESLKEIGIRVENISDIPVLPSHWTWARLGDIITRMDSGWSPACLAEPAAEKAWGVLKTTAVQTLQYQEYQNKKLPLNLEPRPEHEVMEGDILFTRAGPMNRVGIVCVARVTRKKLMISDKIIRFHPVSKIDPDFAALALNAGYSSTVIKTLKSGMAESQVNISQPKLKMVPIPVPPLAEQKRILAKVNELMRICNALEGSLTQSQKGADSLAAIIVSHRSTSGSVCGKVAAK